jgi:hypothetical protein
MNEREIHQNGLSLCQPCAGAAYYQAEHQYAMSALLEQDAIV